MSPARWSDILAQIVKDGGPVTPHPDAETARRLAENTPKPVTPRVSKPPVDLHVEQPLDLGEEPPAPVPAQPYRGESTPEPETVETPAENESPVEDEGPDLPDIIARLLTEEDTATLDAEWDRIREAPADDQSEALLPNPPSRRGWRRLFRRAA